VQQVVEYVHRRGIAHRDIKPANVFVLGSAARSANTPVKLLDFGVAKMLLDHTKTSAALAQLGLHGIPFITILTDPTTGGVSASYAMQGDVILAEPGALIGFAGPRVIEQTVRETLPEGFQRSEFLLEHGAIDLILDRRDLRDRISSMLAMMTGQPPLETQAEPA